MDLIEMSEVETEIAALCGLETDRLRIEWRRLYRTEPPPRLSRDLLLRAIAYKIQERTHGCLSQATKRRLRGLAQELETNGHSAFDPGISLKPGARLVREWHGQTHTVIVREDGFEHDGCRHRSLTQIAKRITGVQWSGPRFFGLAKSAGNDSRSPSSSSAGADDEKS
jgi:Protein of unknown function (DUF2924)